MRGLDTNVLLRYVTADDPEQTPRARAVLERAEAEGERRHVSVIDLCELVWNLNSQRYGYSRLIDPVAGIGRVFPHVPEVSARTAARSSP